MAKQVWQALGSIFDTEEEALQYEKSRLEVDKLATFIHKNIDCVGYPDDAAEIAEHLLAHYNITPK